MKCSLVRNAQLGARLGGCVVVPGVHKGLCGDARTAAWLVMLSCMPELGRMLCGWLVGLVQDHVLPHRTPHTRTPTARSPVGWCSRLLSPNRGVSTRAVHATCLLLHMCTHCVAVRSCCDAWLLLLLLAVPHQTGSHCVPWLGSATDR